MPRQENTTADILEPHNNPRWNVVPSQRARLFPFCSVASIRLWVTAPQRAGPFFSGTGWFIFPDTVVTAAHVVDIGPLSNRIPVATWHVEVVPGLTSPNVRPFAEFFAVQLLPHPSWNGTPASPFDVAVIKLPQQVFHSDACFIPSAFSVSQLNRLIVSAVGYPGYLGADTMVIHSGPILALEEQHVFYEVDTEDGQSGGPIVFWPAGTPKPTVVALHVGGRGHGSTPQAQSLNIGLRLREDLLHWIRSSI